MSIPYFYNDVVDVKSSDASQDKATGALIVAGGAGIDENLNVGNDLNVTGNAIITGNLNVNGAITTISTTNTTIKDKLIELATGTTGDTIGDAGIIIERGNSDNAFMGWDESADKFILGTTTATGATTGNLTITPADLTVSDLTVGGLSLSGSLIELNNGAASNSNDSGIIIERGSTGDNAFMGWDESVDKFILGTTTSTRDATGNLTIAPADLAVHGITTSGLFLALDEVEIGSDNTSAHSLDIKSHDLADHGLKLAGTLVTASAAELNILDGVTATAAELNILSGVTADATELNLLDGVTSTTAELNILDGVTATAAELNILSGVTSTTAELNILDGVTATATELNILDGGTSAASTPVVDEDRVVLNDDGTMVQVAVTNLDTYFSATTKTLTNKTLTAPILTAPKFAEGGFIADANGNEMIVFQTIGSAVNALEITNSVTGNAVVIGTSGDDNNIDIDITPKGTGDVNIPTGKLNYGGVITATAAELNILSGVTADATELNLLDGVTATTAELNILSGVTATAAELNYIDVTTAGTAEASKALVLDASKDIAGINNLSVQDLTVLGTQTIVDTVTMNATNAIIFEGASPDEFETTLTIINPTNDRTIHLPDTSGCIPILSVNSNVPITSTPAELNILDGVTATAAELNILDGVTATAAELNILDGVTATAAELNIMDGGKSGETPTLVGADNVVVNNGGTMKQVTLTTLKTYIHAGSSAANDITLGDNTVTINTSSGNTIGIGTNDVVAPITIGNNNTTTGIALIAGTSVISMTSSTTTANSVAITGNSLTTGSGLSITSTSTGRTTGSLVNIAQTGATTTQAGPTLAVSTSATTHQNACIASFTGNSMTIGNAVSISATALTTGSALKITTDNKTNNTKNATALEIVDGFMVMKPTTITIESGAGGTSSGAPIDINLFESSVVFIDNNYSSNGNLYRVVKDGAGGTTYKDGQICHIFYDTLNGCTVRLDFGAVGLCSGSGNARYLTFSSRGQSATVIRVNNKWWIINTGASVS
jgi:hypothetical protein